MPAVRACPPFHHPSDASFPSGRTRCLFFHPASRHLLLLIVLCLCALLGLSPWEGRGGDRHDEVYADDRALPPLVQAYAREPDPDRAELLLADLLARPDTTLDRVEDILRAGPVYGVQPVGLLPSQEVVVGERSEQFGLYVPTSYTPAQSYGLVLCLHGAGFTGDAYLDRWHPRLGDRYLVACPTVPTAAWWTRHAEDTLLATMRTIVDRYRVDRSRIFLTGMSNGGIGALLIGSLHAPVFAGVAPMAAGLDEVLFPLLANFRNTPVYLIHGAKDHVMPVDLSRAIAAQLTDLGYAHVYREHAAEHPLAGGHFFPREELPALVNWFDAQRREPVPTHLTLVKDASHLTPFAWIRVDATDRIAAFSEGLVDSINEAIQQRRYAVIDARLLPGNRVQVLTALVRRYTVLLSRQHIDFSQPVTILTNSQVSYQGMLTPSVETLLRTYRQTHDGSALYSASLTITVPGIP